MYYFLYILILFEWNQTNFVDFLLFTHVVSSCIEIDYYYFFFNDCNIMIDILHFYIIIKFQRTYKKYIKNIKLKVLT